MFIFLLCICVHATDRRVTLWPGNLHSFRGKTQTNKYSFIIIAFALFLFVFFYRRSLGVFAQKEVLVCECLCVCVYAYLDKPVRLEPHGLNFAAQCCLVISAQIDTHTHARTRTHRENVVYLSTLVSNKNSIHDVAP